jgi:hypothetical protein
MLRQPAVTEDQRSKVLQNGVDWIWYDIFLKEVQTYEAGRIRFTGGQYTGHGEMVISL